MTINVEIVSVETSSNANSVVLNVRVNGEFDAGVNLISDDDGSLPNSQQLRQIIADQLVAEWRHREARKKTTNSMIDALRQAVEGKRFDLTKEFDHARQRAQRVRPIQQELSTS